MLPWQLVTTLKQQIKYIERKKMATLNKKNFDNPDETMTPEKMKVDSVDLGNGVKAARLTSQPGWKWSECIKPMVGTESCQKNHVGVCVQGKIMVTHEDGSSIEVGPGDAYTFAPGHDAWVVGEEEFVGYEFDSSTAATYAKE